MIRKLVITILVLILLFAFIYWWTKPSGGFNSGDSEVKALISAIESYEQNNGYPPDNLQDLIPNYKESIVLPYGVLNIEYSVNADNESWELIYNTGCGFIDIYHSSGIWQHIFPSAPCSEYDK